MFATPAATDSRRANLGLAGDEVVVPIDVVEDRVALQSVAALNVMEGVGPGRQA